MGCFLTMTSRDLAQLRSALKTAVSTAGSPGPGQVTIQVSAVGYRSARQMAALIRNEARSAQVVKGNDGAVARPMRERFQHLYAEAYAISPSLANLMGQAIDRAYHREMMRAGKIEAEPIAAAILQQSGYLDTITKITRSKGVDIVGTSKAGQQVLVEVKLSGIEEDFGKRLKSGVYKKYFPEGVRQMDDDWIKRDIPDADPESAHILGIWIDPLRNRITLSRRIDRDAHDWKPLMDVPLSQFDLSQFE